ncbi:hypothetical protein JTB14_026727 [Gonioctena quinquepunctata]|nr:hypothetical protein JTB14_026727 [Gonioctena quinquepunctata]
MGNVVGNASINPKTQKANAYRHHQNLREQRLLVFKPGKPRFPGSYRPIASQLLKLLERLLHNRICPAVDVLIPENRLGLRVGVADDQVLSLKPHRRGFEGD